MTEVLFYHLQNITVESVLPPLLEKSLERGWRVVVQSTSQERADALDGHLWTYRDDSFLPHATWRAGDAADQPIVLTLEAGNPNRAKVRFLIDKAALPADSVGVFVLPPSIGALEQRLRGRGSDDAGEVARRMAAARAEISHWSEFDHVLVNEDLDACVAGVRAVLQAARCTTARSLGVAALAQAMSGVGG